MNSFFRVYELTKDRKVNFTRTIAKTNFSFILFSLCDNSTIVVVRARKFVKGKLRSFDVVDIQALSCTLQICYQMIKNDKFDFFKEKTNELN